MKKKLFDEHGNPIGSPTPREQKFVELYLGNGKKGPAAYKEATGTSSVGAALNAAFHRFMKRPHVKALLKRADFKVAQKMEVILDKYSVTKEQVLEELAKLAFTNVTDVMEWSEDGVVVKPSKDLSEAAKASITEVSESVDKEGNSKIRIKTADKRAALETIAKTLGMFQEKVNHDHRHAHIQFIIEGKEEAKV